MDPAVTTPLVWSEAHVRAEDIAYFRGDNAWVWQVRGENANPLSSALAFHYLKGIDRRGLLETLPEDDLFGDFTLEIGGRTVSRDLLDSVLEIYSLERRFGVSSLSGVRVLDIGAGYGRLAHRLCAALPGVERYYCTDAVPVSTFVCEYYLSFRGVRNASVIPLDEIEETLRRERIDVAVNIHSFSECAPQAIEWWIGLLSRRGVPRLMIVPNRVTGAGEQLLTNSGYDFLPILEKYGYRRVFRDPKYGEPLLQQFAPHPTWHHFLELQ